MIGRATLRTVVAALAVLAVCMVGQAKTYRVSPRQPIAVVNLPDAWSVSEIARGLQSATVDEEVYLWIEVYRPADYKTVVAEHETYFRKQGVTFQGTPDRATTQAGTATIVVTELPAQWRGVKTIIRYLELDPGLPSGQKVLMSYWASPEGDKKYAAEVEAIISSLAPAP